MIQQTTTTTSPPLNDVQLMLLQLFSRPMAEQEVQAIRKMLLEYYEHLLQAEIDVVIAEKQIKRADFDQVLNRDQRSK